MQKNFYQTVTGLFGRFKGLSSLMPVLAVAFLVFAEPAMAGGGLQKANTAMEEIKTWAYSILGIGIFIYIMYHVVMALMNKGTWADVVMALAYSAAAGAVIVLGEWAWGIWGS